jgi:NAD(P)-dependent dehydrogenase (short-subunit alcohol dehydrogenase family)
MSGRFEGRVVIVTGAAGGIGRATAGRLAREGARIVAVDLKDALDEGVAGLEATGAEVLGVAADVTRAAEVEGYVAAAERHFGGVDALFNNAGIEGAVAPIDAYPDEIFDGVLAVNVRGVFLGMKHVIPALRRRGGGAVVNTASIAGLIGEAAIPAYVASKHAVIGLTKCAAQAYGPEGIRVNAICPAMIETRMMRSLETGVAPADPEAVKREFAARVPMGRYGTPEEVADLVSFLLSDEARFVNGSAYTLDGGMTPF